MNYRKVNNLVGWITGAIAFIVYLKTMEPTCSFWDCGEFITCAYKLEGGHAPGFPTLMMLQRLFALFAGKAAITGAPSVSTLGVVGAATCINALTSVMSSLTILFLFWTISYFAKKLVAPDNAEPTNNQIILIIGASLVGALAYAFSDTFWFSAVEAIPFGTSPFFTAFAFWCILKWDRVADNKYADRWFILVALLIGLAVGVHLLILLVIPPIAMIYYFRKYEATWVGAMTAFIVGCVVVAFIMFGIIRYMPKIAAGFDILFTNQFGMSFDTGAITFLFLVAISLITLLVYAKNRKSLLLYVSIACDVLIIIGGFYSNPVFMFLLLVVLGGVLYLFKRMQNKPYQLVHTSVLCVMFIIIGYSTYFSAIIRARAGVPINMTNPRNPNNFLDYVDREQFGQQPIFFGPYYTSSYSSIDTSEKLYAQDTVNGKDAYVIVGKKEEPVYEGSQSHFFPRVYDGNEAAHRNFYREFLGLKEGEEPTTADNFKYFFGYQMNWMWWRFFMWNYAGRQNDIEGQGDPQKGNWISGIGFVDNNIRGLGDASKMSDGYSIDHNKLYFLPFILGLLGLMYQFGRSKKNGLVVFTLFFFTGAAIGIYLNMPPLQPRERDYAFAGSTYTFAIWIGLGVLMVNEWLKKLIKGNKSAFIAILFCLITVPALMAKVEWKHHDRSRKTLARDIAFNTLSSCPQNAILFAYGDNQTYPLWYMQEVEGFRKDVRVINTSLLGIDWYIEELNYKINDADAVPMVWKKSDYMGDHNNYVLVAADPRLPQDKYYNLTEICNFMDSRDPTNKRETTSGDMLNFMPSKNFFVPTPDKEALVKNGLISAADTAYISADMKWTYPKNGVVKNDVAMLNIIAGVANDGWKRPICFDANLDQGEYCGAGDYMKQEGIIYRLVPYKYNEPIKSARQSVEGTVDIDSTYDLYMHKFLWGGGDRKGVYFDEPNRREFYTLRLDAAFLANALSAENKKDAAVQVLDTVMAKIPNEAYPVNLDMIGYQIARAYYEAIDTGATHAATLKKAHDLTMKIVTDAEDDINWIGTLHDNEKDEMAGEVRQQFSIIQSLYKISEGYGDSTTANLLMPKLERIYKTYAPILNAKNNNQGGEEEQPE